MQAVGRHYGKLREALLDLERAQPAAVPAAAVRQRPAGVAGALPQPLPRRLRGSEGVGQLRRDEGPDGRDLADRRAGRGDPGAARVPARRAVPGRQLSPGRPLREAPGRRLRAAPLHEQRSGRSGCPAASRTPTTTTSRSRRSGAWSARWTAPPRRARSAPDLPIYVTEFGIQSYPNHVLGVPLAQQAEFQAISEKIAWSNPRVVLLRPVPAARRPAQTTASSRASRPPRARSSRSTAASACRSS